MSPVTLFGAWDPIEVLARRALVALHLRLPRDTIPHVIAVMKFQQR